MQSVPYFLTCDWCVLLNTSYAIGVRNRQIWSLSRNKTQSRVSATKYYVIAEKFTYESFSTENKRSLKFRYAVEYLGISTTIVIIAEFLKRFCAYTTS